MGGGEARIIFRLFPIDVDFPRTTIVKSADGKSTEFKSDERDHPVKVPASFPEATMIRVDTTPILLMLTKGVPVYFIHDHDETWSFISARTSTTIGGKAPTVICVPKPGLCPEGYVESGDPHFVPDRRCPK